MAEIGAASFGLVTDAKQAFVLAGETLKGQLGKPRNGQQIGESQTWFLEPFIAKNRLVDQRPVDERKLVFVQEIVYIRSSSA